MAFSLIFSIHAAFAYGTAWRVPGRWGKMRGGYVLTVEFSKLQKQLTHLDQLRRLARQDPQLTRFSGDERTKLIKAIHYYWTIICQPSKSRVGGEGCQPSSDQSIEEEEYVAMEEGKRSQTNERTPQRKRSSPEPAPARSGSSGEPVAACEQAHEPTPVRMLYTDERMPADQAIEDWIFALESGYQTLEDLYEQRKLEQFRTWAYEMKVSLRGLEHLVYLERLVVDIAEEIG
jgi:hypothetical protein